MIYLGEFSGRLANQIWEIASTIGIANANNCGYSIPKFELDYLFNYEFNTYEKLPENLLRVDEGVHTYHEIKGNNISIFGYFQSEKYFKEIEDSIRKIFTLKLLYQHQINVLFNEFDVDNPCSIHVRRTDYLHGNDSLPDEYYHKAITKIGSDRKFLVFSDDIAYAQNLLSPYNCSFVHNDSWIDLYLMSKCTDHIIANSTFSWWGAWLNPNKNKQVLCPPTWLKFNKTEDIISEDSNWQIVSL